MLLCSGRDEYFLSKFANLYVAFATIPDHVAYLNSGTGSKYIQKLCNVLDDKELTNTNPVGDLLNEVSIRLSKIVIKDNYAQTTDVRTIGPMSHSWYLPIRK
jgi:hypothetical protein